MLSRAPSQATRCLSSGCTPPRSIIAMRILPSSQHTTERMAFIVDGNFWRSQRRPASRTIRMCRGLEAWQPSPAVTRSTSTRGSGPSARPRGSYYASSVRWRRNCTVFQQSLNTVAGLDLRPRSLSDILQDIVGQCLGEAVTIPTEHCVIMRASHPRQDGYESIRCSDRRSSGTRQDCDSSPNQLRLPQYP